MPPQLHYCTAAAAPTPPPWHASGQNLEFWRVLTVDTAVWVVAEHNLRWLQWVSTFHIRVHDETVTSQLHYPGNLHMLGFGRAGGRFINDASLSSVREAGRREAPMALLCTATKFFIGGKYDLIQLHRNIIHQNDLIPWEIDSPPAFFKQQVWHCCTCFFSLFLFQPTAKQNQPNS